MFRVQYLGWAAVGISVKINDTKLKKVKKYISFIETLCLFSSDSRDIRRDVKITLTDYSFKI